MKKIVISLAGVLAATAFAPEAAAVPAFARQVGMSCFACHAQHFPVLNSFGRAFKAGGYTMMGAQGKVEGDDHAKLSIPDTLNTSIVMKIRHQKDNTAGVTGAKTSQPQALGDGELQFFDEFALLMGGRVAENVGFLLEAQMIDPSGPFAAGFKMPFVFDMGAAKVSVIPFETDALSVQYGYEQSSGGVLRSNRWAEHRREISAIQYNADRGGDGGAATGVAFAVQNDMGFINVTKYAATQGGGSTLGSTYLRVAATPTVGSWPMVVGLGKMSGQSFSSGAGRTVDTKQTFVDFQAQGEVAGKELGVYVQYAVAPATANGNAYNSRLCGSNRTAGTCAATGADDLTLRSNNMGNPDRKAMTIGADWSVMPHVLSVGAAYRKAETGGAAATNGDDAITVTAVYDLYQNVALHANFSTYSGTSRDAAGSQTNLRTLMLEAAF